MSIVFDILERLESRGVGVDGTTLFGGSRASLPDGVSFITVRSYEPARAIGTHNHGRNAIQEPRAMVVAHGVDGGGKTAYENAEALAALAGAALEVRNTFINGTRYLHMTPRLPGSDLGTDTKNRPRVGFGVEAETA